MIVVDTSAVVAILEVEPERDALLRRLIDADSAISAATVLECSIVLRGLRRVPATDAEGALDQFLGEAGLAIEPVTIEDLHQARLAHIRFGKGTGHPAQLNFGDCFSYALAQRMQAPLLFKGKDFTHTDIISAL